jgi:hypothetical protein
MYNGTAVVGLQELSLRYEVTLRKRNWMPKVYVFLHPPFPSLSSPAKRTKTTFGIPDDVSEADIIIYPAFWY